MLPSDTPKSLHELAFQKIIDMNEATVVLDSKCSGVQSATINLPVISPLVLTNYEDNYEHTIEIYFELCYICYVCTVHIKHTLYNFVLLPWQQNTWENGKKL